MMGVWEEGLSEWEWFGCACEQCGCVLWTGLGCGGDINN